MFDSKSIAQETSQPKRFEFGINTDIFFSDLKVGKTENGKDYVDIEFVQKTGDTVSREDRKRLWWPDPNMVTARDGETAEQALLRDTKKKLGHLIYVLETAYKKPLNIEARSWDEFIQKCLAFVKSNGKSTTRMNILMQYTAKGDYTEIPNFFTYLEVAEEGKTSMLKFNKWQQENRATKAKGDETKAPSTTNIADFY